MKKDLQIPPRTAMEVFKLLPEGTLCEVINGQLFMSPSPFTKHQIIVTDLLTDINYYCRKTKIAKAFVAPFDVYLDEDSNAVQPDIIVVLKENEGIIKDHIHGVPDILIEVSSEGNRDHDLVTKKHLYQKFGVKEYYIIDPETKVVLHFQLNDSNYNLINEQTGRLTSFLLGTTFEF
ncbi:MAG: Uma2 family endonuclease [Chitinophagaceae bacterium]|jgi:Uma2 family endonuclease|nr:Uma2 family endonuclease [Chitinophagaceae bacterium]